MATIPRVPTQNAKQYTLDSQLAAAGTTATLNESVASVVRAPGYFVIDRVDSNGNATNDKREYIKFEGVSGADLQTLTRGLGGSTDQVHAVGAIVEFVPDVLYEQDWYDGFITEHTTTGTHVSLPSLTFVRSAHLTASAASLEGFPVRPTFVITDGSSGASMVGRPLIMPATANIEYIAISTRGPVSTESLVIDIDKNFTSIFTDQGTRPAVEGAGTFVSTASIGTTVFNAGDTLHVDVDIAPGTVPDFTVHIGAR